MNHPHSIDIDNAWHQQLPAGQVKYFQKQEIIVSPNAEINQVFVLETGKARICLFGAAREQTLGYLNQGSIYVTHTPVWIEAIENCSIRSWPVHQIKALFQSKPELAIAAIRDIGKLLYTAIDMIEDFAFRSVESRLARYLLKDSGRQTEQVIELPGSVQSLACLLGTSRQTLSSLLNRLEKEGLIARPSRMQVRVVDLATLQEMADSVSSS